MHSIPNISGRWLIILTTILPLFVSCRSVRIYSSDIQRVAKEEFLGILPAEMQETSGLENLDGKLLTFNDSGGEAALFSFQPSKPSEYRKHIPENAENTDWEDITIGNGFVFIGDVGNNNGSRDTLSIYALPASEFNEDSISLSHTLYFSFADKPVGITGMFKNPFDCEALCYINDSLWIFTKDWIGYTSGIYKLPSLSTGHQSLSRVWEINPSMLVTGADYCEETGHLWLIGYRRFQPVIKVYKILPGNLPPGEIVRVKLGNRTGLQTEAITCADDGYIYFSYEKSKRRQGLFRIKL